MPSLPSKTARRKHVTPIANLHENDVWQRTFKLLGLQPLTPFPDLAPDADNFSRTFEMATATDIEAPSADTVESKKPKITILDLPAETQEDIFKHVCSTIQRLFILPTRPSMCRSQHPETLLTRRSPM